MILLKVIYWLFVKDNKLNFLNKIYQVDKFNGK